jgi:hypothetical protein
MAHSRPCFERAAMPSKVGRAARDNEAPAPPAGRSDITRPSSLTTSAPTGGSGAGAGRLPHWSHPGGGVSSSGTFTTAAWPPLIGASAGEIDGTETTVVMVAVVAAATCCGSATAATLCEASPVAVAALPVSRGTLDERRLVGTDASALSTFAGARGDGRRHPANAKSKRLN